MLNSRVARLPEKLMLIIDVDKRVCYEGSGGVGIPIWPSPFVSVATIVRADEDIKEVPARTDLGTAKLLFREDYFDPVTRIRRGRFYNHGGGSQPQNVHVQAHPALQSEARALDINGLHEKLLHRFHDWAARTHLGKSAQRVTVVLGVQGAMTLWRVVGIEQISTGEDLVTLKSHSNMGVLPDLSEAAVPAGGAMRVLQTMESLIDTAYRGGPESVIDRCRDLASAALGARFEALHPKASHKDLGELVRIAKGERRYLIENAASLINLLHSRGKPNVQNERGTAPPEPEDAAVALECMSLILRELGWVTP
jgi:hypothetical protein